MDKIPVRHIRKAMLEYKLARTAIFKSLGSIVQNIEHMDKAIMSIKLGLTVEPKEGKVNVFNKIFQIVRGRIKA
ncbi:hypothetical protein LCGC14_2688580 [marine sediment metagenome]|uniref:Uncharacterized protein n=1 Tax=marine sediment metagenome TaxID=412755 RepID=A0A0F8ZJ92_9ZZZZ